MPRAAQLKIEAALEEMNREAKEIISLKGTWRRGGAAKKVRSSGIKGTWRREGVIVKVRSSASRES